LATIFKKSEFCTEQETRLILYLKDGSPIKTSSNGQKQINYYELPFHAGSLSQLIKSITIGPANHLANINHELNILLKNHNLENITINHCKTSYKEFSGSKPLNQKICQNCEWFTPTSQGEFNNIN